MDWAKFWNNAGYALGIALAVLRAIWTPLSLVLSILLRVILIATSPLQWLGLFIYRCLAFPIRVLAKFETLFYYFGTACILGLVAGTGLYYSVRLLSNTLRLDDQDQKPLSKSTRGRTAASYRAERAQKQAEQAWNQLRLNDMPLPSDSEFKSDSRGWSPGGGLARYPLSPSAEKKGLLSTTIFEEEDSSDYTDL